MHIAIMGILLTDVHLHSVPDGQTKPCPHGRHSYSLVPVHTRQPQSEIHSSVLEFRSDYTSFHSQQSMICVPFTAIKHTM